MAKKHGTFCTCSRCMNRVYKNLDRDRARERARHERPSSGSFSTTDKNGGRIWGDKRQEKHMKKGYKHGHDWGSGYRTPHSALGHTAVHGTPGSPDDHKHKR